MAWPESPLTGKWELTDWFCHEEINHVLVTASLPSERNGLGTAYVHMERSASGFGGYKRNLMVVELPESPPTRTQDCQFDFDGTKAPFSSLYFYAWRKDGYLRTTETRFGSPCGEGHDCYETLEDLMTQGGILTARIGAGTWTFELDGFVQIEDLAEHALDIRQQPSYSEVGGFARSLSLLGDSRLTMTDIQNFLIADIAGLKLFVEGALDLRYITRAAQLLGKSTLMEKVDIAELGGVGNLKKLWAGLTTSADNLVRGQALLLFDCDSNVQSDKVRNIQKHCLPRQVDNPLRTGIENLFQRPLLERATNAWPEFIDITTAHHKKIRGRSEAVPETWTANPDEKTRLCDWICQHGTADDFRDFQQVFDILEGLMP